MVKTQIPIKNSSFDI